MLAVALVGVVLLLDLLRSMLEGSTGSLSYGLVDEPAHLATCAVALLALVAVRAAAARRPPSGSGRFRVGAMTAVTLVVVGLGASSAAASYPISMGAYLPGVEENPGLIDTYTAEVGTSPVIVSTYTDWTRPLVNPTYLNAVWSRGAVPLLSWEPWDWSDRSRVFRFRAIAKGRYDAYIEASARAVASWGNPILLRFAHEVNGRWYPWGAGLNGTTPRTYIAAWRHIVRIFRANGARNAKWVWTPYVRVGDRFPFVRFYPGDRWVDWVGLDGLNGGAVFGWRPFTKIFAASYRQLVAITSRPVILAEMGSTEDGGMKSAWVSTALGRGIPRFSHIRAIVWWSTQDPKGRGDFRVGSSPTALAAIREALATTRYESDRSLLLATPRRIGHLPRRAKHSHKGRR